ncbi:MAG: T9SS type A sorting domain-containing protein [Bacteroidales bacterium]|nr:T9SS type A sorting domain-containing protein [Bacteroidales bacterium]MBN2820822.1 T9SS type A sorting domain-containing protein [Bacteroidales bacterium]
MKYKAFSYYLALFLSLFIGKIAYSQHYDPLRIWEEVPRNWSSDVILDGVDDECFWSEATDLGEPVIETDDWTGEQDLSAYIKLCWDLDNLYFFAHVEDDINSAFDGSTEDWWLYDNVEIYFDLDTASNKGEYDYFSFQIRYNRGLDTLINTTGCNGKNLNNFVVAEGENSWQIEAIIPWHGLISDALFAEELWNYVNKNAIGFDVIVNDNDGEQGSRECQLTWDADGEDDDELEDNAWYDTRTFGILKLSNKSNCVAYTQANDYKADDNYIFPNPANEYLFIKNNSEIESIEIYSIQGQLIKKVNRNILATGIDLSGILQGEYIIKIHTRNTTINEKLVVL